MDDIEYIDKDDFHEEPYLDYDKLDLIYNQCIIEKFPLPTEEQISKLELEINRRFPPQYRTFLINYNGGIFDFTDKCAVINHENINVLSISLDYLFSYNGPDYSTINQKDYLLLDGNEPPILFPIGADSGGSLLIIVLDEQADDYGAIIYKKISDDFYYMCDNFNELIDMIQIENNSP